MVMSTLTVGLIVTAFGAVFSLAIGILYKVMDKKIKAAQDAAENARIENNAIKHGMVGLLRNSLIRTCHDSTDKGYAPMYVRDNVAELYKDYEDLKGNGPIKNLVEKFHKLPFKKPNN